MKHIFIQSKNNNNVDCSQRNIECPLISYATRRDIEYNVEVIKAGEYNINFTKTHTSDLYSEYSTLFKEMCNVCCKHNHNK